MGLKFCSGLLFLAIALCASTLVVAQSEFREGFVVRAEGDTMRGLVDFSRSADHFDICRFKAGEATRDYKPSELVGYGFKLDKYYQSRTLLFPDSTSGRVFIEVVVSGIVSLYRYYDTFYLEKGEEFIELTNPSQQVFVQGQYITRRSRRFAQVANMMMADCEALRKAIEHLNLNERSLTEAVEKYNQCKGTSYTNYKARKPWVRAVFGLEGGFSYSTLTVEHLTQLPTHLNGTYEPSMTYIVGMPFEVFSPRISEGTSLVLGVNYTNPKYYNYNTYTTAGFTQLNYVTIEVSQLKIPIGFKPRLVKAQKYEVFLSLGFMNTLRLDSKTHWLSETESNGTVVFTEKDAIQMTNYQAGYWAGLEVARELGPKAKGFLNIRFEGMEGLTDSFYDKDEVATKVTYWQVMAGIRMR